MKMLWQPSICSLYFRCASSMERKLPQPKRKLSSVTSSDAAMQGPGTTKTLAPTIVPSTIPITSASTDQVSPVAAPASTATKQVPQTTSSQSHHGACKFWGSTSTTFQKIRSDSNVFNLPFIKQFHEKAVAANLAISLPHSLLVFS